MFYDGLIDPAADSQLTFPHIDSVAGTRLTYVDKLSEGRYAYQAVLEDGRDVVVKFALNYSAACHRGCHALGIAPELIGCESLPGGWCAVVMELLDGHTTLQKRRLPRATVERAVGQIHEAGFVHGDLRLPNILVGPDDAIKIIDFDWAGTVGEAVYPPLLNPDIPWHPDVKLGAKILPEHDLHLLKAECAHLE